MFGKLIVFVVYTKGNRTKSSMFAKTFYGQKTSSHKGKYKYRRKGFLDDIPHIKLIRGAIIVNDGDLKNVLSFLGQYDTKIFVRNVELEGEEIQILYEM